ncbi:WD40 repeat-like protein [Rhodotorula sp. JG-1b]|nr:WD40 repeat-like protein [Rhodotorula sp. JG-1b]
MLADPVSRESPFVALTFLALAPPHRPAALQAELYSPLLSSHSWIKRFSVLQELGDPDVAANLGGRGGIPRGHTVISEAYGSTGCVNASAWEDRGPEARLATAGDDTKICIWSPGVEGELRSRGGEAQSPVLGYGLTDTIDTGHRANIFDVAWAPSTRNDLFSVAGDHTVRVFDISLATNPKLSSMTITPPAPHRPFQHHEEASACTAVYRCHTDRVKRIATEASSHVFLTCGEDGTVRQHDTRVHHNCRTSRFQAPGEADCPLPLASYPSLSLYSLSLSLLRPHLFVVAGTSPYAYLHDRRMIRQASSDWSLPSSSLAGSDDLTVCVRRFGVPDPKEPWKGDLTKQIVSARLSPDRPRDLLVSYSDDAVYLFDTDGETFVRPRKPRHPGEDEMWRGGEQSEGDENDSPGGGLSDEDGEDDELQEMEEAETENGANARAEHEEKGDPPTGRETSVGDDDEEMSEEGEDDDDDDDEEEEDLPFDPFVKPARLAPHSEIPMVAPWRRYDGHANSQTVKDCNFVFSDMVVSGSDDGNWFAWDRATAEIIGIFHGDESVVNVMTPHPKLPIVAVSGIDEVVKLFGATSDPEIIESSNLAKDYDAIKRRNARGEGRAHFASAIGAERLIQMLFGGAGIPLGIGGEADDDENEGDDEVGAGEEDGGGGGGGEATGGRQQRRQPHPRVRIVTSGEDGNETAQECLLM